MSADPDTVVAATQATKRKKGGVGLIPYHNLVIPEFPRCSRDNVATIPYRPNECRIPYRQRCSKRRTLAAGDMCCSRKIIKAFARRQTQGSLVVEYYCLGLAPYAHSPNAMHCTRVIIFSTTSYYSNIPRFYHAGTSRVLKANDAHVMLSSLNAVDINRHPNNYTQSI